MIVLFNERQFLSVALSSDCRLHAIDGLSARNAIRSGTSHKQAHFTVLASILSAQANNHG
jgi:hypothetical protein